ncbi:actin ARP6 [Pyrrhoderma noxium]|uniref:Actin-like protein ARP6 n=1 Tax=Pyrrhoderma noxium TaxID=2282107 RepID=A0A286UCV4_9AGAM|nr:actin ARP6 [Pyrrhoderma noxium]
MQVLVVDNGAWKIKAGVIVSGNGEDVIQKPRMVTNGIVRQTRGEKRMFFGHEFDHCKDHSSLHFRLPFERGLLTDWDAQKAVWDGLFSKSVLNVDTSDSALLITEPYFNLPNIQEQYDQLVFEEYEFKEYYRCTPASLAPFGDLFGESAPECMLIVDTGFSFTHIVPLVSGRILWEAVRRIDVGGKLLTNHLKEMLSYRQLDLMGETYITNEVKERCCYVSLDYSRDMELARSGSSQIVQEYVLPNYSVGEGGRVRTSKESAEGEEDVLRLGSERFAVPEVLFRPSDIGLKQSGLARTIADAIGSVDTSLQGFKERLQAELRTLAPTEFEVRIMESANPICAAYFGGASLARDGGIGKLGITRGEYLESGSNAWRRRNDGGTDNDIDGAVKEVRESHLGHSDDKSDEHRRHSFIVH